MSNIVLTKQDIQKLSTSAQNEIISLIFNKNLSDNQEETFGELNKKQVFDLIDGLSDKSKSVLKSAAFFGENTIIFSDLLKNLNVEEKDIKGVWSGLTSRSRNISNNPDFCFICWEWSEDEQSHLMKFHPKTYEHIVSYFQ